MPLLNQTGPMGLGPYTGRGYGTCNSSLATVGDAGNSGSSKLAAPVGLGVVGGVVGWFFRGTIGAAVGVVAGVVAGSVRSKGKSGPLLGVWTDKAEAEYQTAKEEGMGTSMTESAMGMYDDTELQTY